MRYLIMVIAALALIVGVLIMVRPGWSIDGWRYGRNLPWMIAAMLRWPRLAAHSGMGRMRPWKPGGRDHPVNWPGTKTWLLTPAGFSFVVKHKLGQSSDTVKAAIPALSSGMHGQVRVAGVHNKPHQSRVIVLRRDPFKRVPAPLALSPTALSWRTVGTS
jgi:hypothetical protein